MARLRKGRANTARGAANFLREMVSRVRHAGATGPLACGPTAASTPASSSPPAATRTYATLSRCASTPACVTSSRPFPRRTGHPSRTVWTAPPTWPRLNTLPSRTSPTPVPVRLIVRRVKPTPCSQLALFTNYSYHGFITDREGDTLELEADHRRHAKIENAIRDLKYFVGLNHFPSGCFPANGARLPSSGASASDCFPLGISTYAACCTALSSWSTSAATIQGSTACSSRRLVLPAGGNLILMWE